MKTKLFYIAFLIIGLSYYFSINNDSNSIEQSNIFLFEDNLELKVTLVNSKVVDKNGIGNEWSFQSSIAGNPLTRGQVKQIHLNNKSEITIKSLAIESDPSSDDEGYSNITITPQNINNIVKKSPIIKTVMVKEYYGSGRGNTAICEFTYVLSIDTIQKDIVLN